MRIAGTILTSPLFIKIKAYVIIDAMVEIGKNHNTSAAKIALSWLRRKPGVTSIIIGAKKHDQLLDNIASINLELTQEEMKVLDNISTHTAKYTGWVMERQLIGRFPE